MANEPLNHDNSNEAECLQIISKLKLAGVNFVAIDFDLTLISEHTSGKWDGSTEDLATKTRPFFRCFIPLALSNGILIAIVTLSPQVKMISDLLRIVFPSFADYIPVRGEDNSWGYQGHGCCEGKQRHMASAAEELIIANAPACKITRASTLLVDDDLSNVFTALKNKTRAVLCDPSNIHRMVQDLMIIV